MDLRNCPKCGRAFAFDGIHKLCTRCRQEEEGEFQQVKQYIYDNPNASVQEVSEKTGVETKKILRFLREGRLEISSSEANLLLECESCGKPIRTGRFCDSCAKRLENELRSSIAPKKKDIDNKNEKDRMYVANKYKR